MPETVTMFKVLCIVELRSTYDSRNLRSPLMDGRKRSHRVSGLALAVFRGKRILSYRR